MNTTILAETLNRHFKRYPQMRIQDVYKLLYQAVMGAEHLLHGAAFQRLQEEWNRLDTGSEESLFESIAVDSTEIGRLNLRPAKQQGLGIEWVWDVFSCSAGDMQADHQKFINVWRHFIESRNYRQIKYADAVQFDKEMADAGYPVMHHSEPYRAAYYPAYRVVSKKYLILETSRE